MRYLPALLLGLLAIGCNRSGDTMTRYHEDGRAKPVVAIAPMIDTTMFDAPWSLSEELTSMIVHKISEKGKIFVGSKEDDAFVENPFGNELSWIKRKFQTQEFVVFLELVQHEAAPANAQRKDATAQDSSTNLEMAVRLRVVDLRGSSPKIVLQETVRDTYFIPKSLFPTDYNVVVWGTDEFYKSPMGIAHAQLVQEIAARISDYILLAKSR